MVSHWIEQKLRVQNALKNLDEIKEEMFSDENKANNPNKYNIMDELEIWENQKIEEE